MAKKQTARRSRGTARKSAPKDSMVKEICIPQRPRTRAGLQRAAKALLGVTFPQKAICPHHNSPLDYLEASFLREEDLLVWANRGGGKTMLAAAATLLDALYRAPIKICVLGGSFDQSDRLGEYIREFVNRRPELLDGSIRRDRVKIRGGSEIRMLAQSQRAVRGQHVQKIRCDEVDLFDSEVWEAVQFAPRSTDHTRGSIEVLSTLHRQGGLMHRLVQAARENIESRNGDCESKDSRSAETQDDDDPNFKTPNRPPGYQLVNWCLWEVIEKCPPQRRCKGCLLAEDCRSAARRGEGFFHIDDAIAIKARSSRAAWESEMLCRGPQRQWLVFEEFDPNIHIRKVEYCPDWPLFRAIDFGYSNPLVCLWIQLTPAGGVHVLKEYIRTRLPVSRHAAEILKRDYGPVQVTYVDPAGNHRESTSGAACRELLAAACISCVWKGSSISDVRELIRAALAPAAGNPTLYIHPRCRGLIDSFNNYHYPPPESSADPDRPVKDGPDHAIDALRYFFINKMRPKICVNRARY